MDDNLRQRLLQALQALEFLADSQEGQEAVSQEAASLQWILKQIVLTKHADPRILQQQGRIRLVAPGLRTAERGTYLNGRLVIEVAQEDSLGAEQWRPLSELKWDDRDPEVKATMVLFAAGRFDDRELREFAK